MNAATTALDRAWEYEMRLARQRDERQRDERERRLRMEVERLEGVVRAIRASIDAERDKNRDSTEEGRDASSQCHAD